jgi:tetratricopeptide (TPR) repeat protein
MLIERAEGNPLFLEESVRTLVETSVLAGERGAYFLAGTSRLPQIPPTTQAILAARIDRLAPADKRVVQTACVLGKNVPFALLQAIADMPEDTLHGSLAALRNADFLYEARLFPDLEYTFKHALTHEVAYASLPQERRRLLHSRVVNALETLYPERLVEQVEQLADHAFKGQMWGKAVQYSRQAGAKAFARSAHREAVVRFEQALEALGHLPEERHTLEQAIDLRFELRNALFLLGELEGVFGHLCEAQRLADALADDTRRGWASAYMAHYLWWTGRSTEARVCAQQARTIADTVDEVPLRIAANLYLGFTMHTAGDYRGAERVLRELADSLQGDLSRERFGQHAFPAVNCRSHLVWALAELGAFGEGIARGEEGVRLAQSVDHPYSLVLAFWGLGSLYIFKGDYREAERLLDRAMALCHQWTLRGLSPLIMAAAGYAHALSGRLSDGLTLQRQAIGAMESMRFTLFHGFALVTAGEACLLADQVGNALAFAERSLTLTRERGERGFEAWSRRLLGDIALRTDPPDYAKGEGEFRAALALADRLGMRPLVAHCHLGLAYLTRSMHRPDEAREHFLASMSMYRRMEMESWLRRVQAECGQPR